MVVEGREERQTQNTAMSRRGMARVHIVKSLMQAFAPLHPYIHALRAMAALRAAAREATMWDSDSQGSVTLQNVIEIRYSAWLLVQAAGYFPASRCFCPPRS